MINLTPRCFPLALAAGGVAEINAYGRHILIASITASTIALSLDDDPPQQVLAGEHMDCEEYRYHRILITNTGGVATAVVILLSPMRVDIESTGGLLAAIAGSLVNIDQEISGGPATLQVPDLILPVTPGPGLPILPVNPLATEREITAPPTNGAGLVYLGITAARSIAIDKFITLAAGDIWWSEREKGAVFGCSSTGAEIVNAREC
jgi:hypothetical protein